MYIALIFLSYISCILFHSHLYWNREKRAAMHSHFHICPPFFFMSFNGRFTGHRILLNFDYRQRERWKVKLTLGSCMYRMDATEPTRASNQFSFAKLDNKTLLVSLLAAPFPLHAFPTSCCRYT